MTTSTAAGVLEFFEIPVMFHSICSSFRFLNIIGGLLTLLAALILPGCSAVKLTYNNAPDLVYWWLDSYMDFDSAQATRVRADLLALLAWHRKNELPAYGGALENLQRLAPTNVTPEQLCGAYHDFKPRLQALLDQTAPTVAALSPLFTPEQLTHLTRQLEKRSIKWRQEWLDGTPAERSARRVKQLADRAEYFYGRLEEPQMAILRASVASSAFDPAIHQRESLRRHQDTLQTLQRLQGDNGTPAQRQTEARALLARALNSPDTSYRNYQEKMDQENCKTFATLHNSTTSAQRVKVVEALKDYNTDIRTLMATPR